MDFYDHFYPEGSYTENHRNHFSLWHPDIEEFISVKHTPGEFENANMSVCISDSFMAALENDADWDLVFPNTKDSER